MTKPLIITLFFAFPLFADASLTPPGGWEKVPESEYPPSVEMVFKGKSEKYWYPPSVNLAKEAWQGSLEDYLSTISVSHNKHPHIYFTVIGPYQTDSGQDGKLCFARQRTEYGPVKLIQWITLSDQNIYVITAAARVEEFGKNYKNFIKVFNSFRLTEDLPPSRT